MNNCVRLILLCTVAVCGVSQAAEVVAKSGDVTVQCLTVNKKVIPAYAQCGHLWITNVKLPDLVLINNSGGPVTVGEVVMTGMAGGQEVVVTKVWKDLVEMAMAQVNVQFRAKLGKDVMGNVMDPALATGFGEMDFGGTRLADGATVKPAECGVVLLSQLGFVAYTGVMKLDGLKLTVAVEREGKTHEIECPVPFVAYECKGNYGFPLGGECTLLCMPLNVTQHRKALSQEFAFDILDAGPTVKGISSGAHAPKPSKLEDYAIFHRPVMAVADGTVVATGEEFPDAAQSNPAAISESDLDKLVEEFVPKLGFMHAVAGNYITIDHGNGEFSFYGHLAENSVKVKPGDAVRKGDVIAAVGNTGRSTEPHLHFQMMDGPDFLTANGLPVMFEGIPPRTMNENYKAANTLMGSDYIRLRAGD